MSSNTFPTGDAFDAINAFKIKIAKKIVFIFELFDKCDVYYFDEKTNSFYNRV